MNLWRQGIQKYQGTVTVPLCPPPALNRPARNRICVRNGRFPRCPIYRIVGLGGRRVYVRGPSPAGIVGSNPAAAQTSVSCKCCVLSGRGLCVGLIARPEDSYRMFFV
jgi:hypothetical protein